MEIGMIICICLYLFGLAFGIAGIVQKNRYKILPILGIATNMFMFLGAVLPSLMPTI